jgi:hypothetical protein
MKGLPVSLLPKKVGKITEYMRSAAWADKNEQDTVRKRKGDERYAANVRKKSKQAAIRDHAETILTSCLVTSIEELEVQLAARSTASSARCAFLRDQFHARVSSDTPRNYPGLGKEFRSKHGKLKMTPSDHTTSKEDYLKALISAMITEDGDVIGEPHALPKFTEHFIRVLPTLTPEYTNPVASALKAEFAKQIADLAAPQDDPVYVELQGLYVGKILYDFETRSNAKMFRIVAIQFVRSYTAGRCSCWEATCEPVVRDAGTGQFRVPNDVKVPGSNVTLTHALQGYCLAEYEKGLDADPTYLPWVEQYIAHFRNEILPKYPSMLLDSPSKTQMDSPSITLKDSPSITPKDLPSSRRTRPRRTTKVPDKIGH